MFYYFFRIIIIFPILFFFIIRPINESLLENYIVPYLNDSFINNPYISFNHSNDNLIFKNNDINHYYTLPFNEYYIMFFVIFFSKKILTGYLHLHILNFSIILLIPFFYFCISNQINEAFTFFSVIQSTVNFYFLITITINSLKKYGPKSFKMGLKT